MIIYIVIMVWGLKETWENKGYWGAMRKKPQVGSGRIGRWSVCVHKQNEGIQE